MPPVAALSLKAAAASGGVHPKTLERWCLEGLVLARRLARGTGPWRVYVDAQGQPCDAPPPSRRRR